MDIQRWKVQWNRTSYSWWLGKRCSMVQ